MRRLLLAVLAVMVLAVPALAEPRIALVIGNSDYRGELPKLANPANDASLMTATLRKLGFKVVEVRNADLDDMRQALSDFSGLLAGAGPQAVGLFFYAGHGIQVEGVNYLIPLGADIQRAADADLKALSADMVLKQMNFAGNGLNIIILDACRNNPLSRGMRSASTGLAKMDAPIGTFIAYSTAPGQTAADGKGNNSPYTAALAKAIQKPGIAIEEAFRDARVEVLQTTNKEQIPWESSSLTGAFQFNPGPKTAEPQVAAAAPAPAPATAPTPAPPAPAAKTPAAPNGKAAKCTDCPEMVSIPAGSFMMGSPDSEDERQDNEGPQTKISVRAFSMSKNLITRGQFGEFIAATGYKPADRCEAEMTSNGLKYTDNANWKNPGYSQTDKHPVACVSWDDANAYANWLAQTTGQPYRLPSEAEWEYAGRAGTTTSRFWGDDADDACDYANAADKAAKRKFSGWNVVDCDDGFVYTAPVGSFKPNKFGLNDMLGNLKQMVAGCITDSISDLPTDGSAGTKNCDAHPLRGSSWESIPSVMRMADRQIIQSGEAGFHMGFRVAIGQ
ncbi:SUMF1/EgtB/PvdO family nonheme iron enzyme [Dongia sp. agr-C8]